MTAIPSHTKSSEQKTWQADQVKIYSIRVLDNEHEYGWIKMQATRGVDVEYEDTEEMKVENPLVESRATTTIKINQRRKIPCWKNSIGIRINQLGKQS